MQFHEYAGVRIPVMTSKSARPFYNLPDSEIDKMRGGTLFTDEGECFEPGGFRGTAFEDRFSYLDEREIRERAEFLEREGASIFHLFRDHKVPVKNQGPNGYCWAYGTCTAMEANRLVRGFDYVELSADSVAAPVKRGRDQGGWGTEFYEYATIHGVAPQSMWKLHDRGYKKYETAEVEAERSKYVPEESIDMKPGDMLALQSILASNFAAGVGLMFWGHLVAVSGLTFSDKLGPLYLFRNSHGKNFGVEGWCFMTEFVANHGGGTVIMSST